MLITRRSDYAMRICRALKDKKIHNVREICELEDIPKAFAYKILREMESADLVRSERGNKGGYYLNRDLSDLSMYDVVSVTENDLSILKELVDVKASDDADMHPMVKEEIDRIQNILITEMKRKSIAEILG